MPQDNDTRRDDDFEEFGDDMGMGAPDTRREIHEGDWTEGMNAECSFCGLIAKIPESCRREDGSAGCPRCGGDFIFYLDLQDQEHDEVNITTGWRPGQTGRCSYCGLVARVFGDVAREDGTAACEMCGEGIFEFVYGLPSSATRAPAPKPVYVHEIDGMKIMLSRRFSDEILAKVLELFREGKSSEEILNSPDPELTSFLHENRVTKYALDDIKRAENRRRWPTEPLLYTDEDKERLKSYKMLRVPFNGRIKIVFAGRNGAVERWVEPSIFEDLKEGRKKLVFDGHYKAIDTERIEDEPRFSMALQYYPKCNALLQRGLIRAVSPTGEEIPLEGCEWGHEQQEPEDNEPSCPDCGGHVGMEGEYCPECDPNGDED
jgi:hypothetical protein